LLESGPVREFNISADTTRLDVAGLGMLVIFFFFSNFFIS
jgi:hypothetical protein